MIVDSHCHLSFPDFENDLEDVIKNAEVNNVSIMQTICTNLDEFSDIHEITKNYHNIYCSVGIHPNNILQESDIAEIEQIAKLANLDKVIAIGETGLDYFRNPDKAIMQEKSFRNHIEASRQVGVPIVIHSRDADEHMIKILKDEMNQAEFKAVLHCFSSGRVLAEKSLELGLYISFSGIITFKNAEDLRNIAKDIPKNRLLIETDSPYLAPVPNRGKRNEPAYTAYVNEKLAEIHNINPEEMAKQTTKNFFDLFTKAKVK